MTAMVTMDNYEEYLLLHADGELSGEEEKALQAFIAQHPELQHEMDLYAATKLSPDTEMVYEGKEALLKKETTVISFYASWRTYGAAAGIAALVALGIWKSNGPAERTETNIVQIKQDQGNITAPKDTITGKTQEQKAMANAAAKVNTGIAVPKAATKPEYHYTVNKHRTATANVILASAALKPIQAGNSIAAPEAGSSYEIPVYKPRLEETKATSGFAFFKRKKQNISNLSEAVDDKLDKIRKLKDDVGNTDVVLKFGKKELLIVKL